MGPIGKYQMLQFSKTRELIIDVVEQGLVKHHVTVVLELDVILERQFLRTYIEKQGVDLSITNWMANCIAQAVSENPQVRALRRGGILPELVRGLAGSSARVLGRQYITSVSIPAAAPDASDSHSGVVADHVGTVCRGMATRLVEVALGECDPIHDSAYDYKCAGGAAGTGVEGVELIKILLMAQSGNCTLLRQNITSSCPTYARVSTSKYHHPTSLRKIHRNQVRWLKKF